MARLLAVTSSSTRRWARLLSGACAVLVSAGCLSQAAPAPYSAHESAPPWPAPRDGTSWIREADLPELPLNDTSDPWIIQFHVRYDGKAVTVEPYIGMDRPRAVQAPVHTHDDSGKVWLEGEGNREVTLAQFFTVWGVNLTDTCLADACHGLTVVVDGKPASPPWSAVVLRGKKQIEISASTR